ncbi:MAG: FAD-dependent oxidoreductase [Candidatus Helarchaeota archaeon]|nr:FAD-dependent oxidoreductase [Candidatus Helarchaeota archaeon]
MQYQRALSVRKIFTPIKINKMEVKNRILMPAMHMNYTGSKGEISDKLIAFYEERAKGGCGLIIVGGAHFTKTSFYSPNMLNLMDEDIKKQNIPKLKIFADTIRNAGAKIAIQLLHPGRYGLFGETYAPSPVRSGIKSTGARMPKELTIAQIQEIIEDYAQAALLLKNAGVDAVEICGNTGYLPAQFISKFTNRRTDKYGGKEVTDRMTFNVELLERMREVVGLDYPIIYRMPTDDLLPESSTFKDYSIVAPYLEKAGADMLHCAGGFHESRVPQLTMGVPHAFTAVLAGQIKKTVNIPVALAHRIHDAETMEKILIAGLVDMVGLARPLICDPELPNKLQARQFDEIRWCVACNNCFDCVFQAQPVHCFQNIRAGKELKYKITPTETPKKVIIAGGGVGGMEAARILKMRGHEVILFEKNKYLGGDLYIAGKPPGREEFMRALDFLINQMIKLGVDIRLNTEATTDIILKENPDAVIVATGNVPIIPPIPGIDGKNVVLAKDVLLDKVDVGEQVVIIGGGATGTETALYIARLNSLPAENAMYLVQHGVLSFEDAFEKWRYGKEVTVLDMLPKMGTNIGGTTRWTILKDLAYRGVKLIPNATVEKITEKEVIYKVGEETKSIPCDTVVIAAGAKANRKLNEELKGKVEDLRVIGDAKRPRKAIEALEEGFKTGLRIK